MSEIESPTPVDPGIAESLSASLHWMQFRTAFTTTLNAHVPPRRSASVDLRPLAKAFFAWAAVLDYDASFEALDPVDYTHFAAGQLLVRLLTQRPILLPPMPPNVEARVLIESVLDHLQSWRRAGGAPPIDGLPIDFDGPTWASFIENTTDEPAVAAAFLDKFTGLEPVWRYPQLVAERPAMREARRARR